MTETDCGWPDPQPSPYTVKKLVQLLGSNGAKELSRKAVARYYPIPTDEAIERQLKSSWGYGLDEMEPIKYI